MNTIKKILILFLSFLLLPCCATYKKKSNLVSPQDLLKTLKNSQTNTNKCMSWKIRGSFYLFSKKQNYRANFFLKGNQNGPWNMKITWGMGTLVAIAKLDTHLSMVYSLRENTLYKINNPERALEFIGISSNISYIFLLKVLTGEWKNFIPKPQKAVQTKTGFIYFFKKVPYSQLELSLDLQDIKLKFPCGEEIQIHNNKKITFFYNKKQKVIFNIKLKKCYTTTSFSSKELDLIYPKWTKIKILNQ